MKHRTRLERAEQREAAANHLAQGQPLRQGAADLGVARRTLRINGARLDLFFYLFDHARKGAMMWPVARV